MVLRKIGNRYALISKTDPTKILKWFGSKKPTRKQVLKEERRVQFFKAAKAGKIPLKKIKKIKIRRHIRKTKRKRVMVKPHKRRIRGRRYRVHRQEGFDMAPKVDKLKEVLDESEKEVKILEKKKAEALERQEKGIKLRIPIAQIDENLEEATKDFEKAQRNTQLAEQISLSAALEKEIEERDEEIEEEHLEDVKKEEKETKEALKETIKDQKEIKKDLERREKALEAQQLRLAKREGLEGIRALTDQIKIDKKRTEEILKNLQKEEKFIHIDSPTEEMAKMFALDREITPRRAEQLKKIGLKVTSPIDRLIDLSQKIKSKKAKKLERNLIELKSEFDEGEEWLGRGETFVFK